MAHEKSITVKHGKRWVNLKTVLGRGGKRISARGAADMLRKGTLKPLGGKTFGTMKEAVSAAKRRSRKKPK